MDYLYVDKNGELSLWRRNPNGVGYTVYSKFGAEQVSKLNHDLFELVDSWPSVPAPRGLPPGSIVMVNTQPSFISKVKSFFKEMVNEL